MASGRLPARGTAAFISVGSGSPGGQPAPRNRIEFMPILTRMGATDGAIQDPSKKTVRHMNVPATGRKGFQEDARAGETSRRFRPPRACYLTSWMLSFTLCAPTE